MFLLYELPQPLGKRSSRFNNIEQQQQETNPDKKQLRQQERYLVNYEKKFVIKKVDALDLLKDLKIKVHFDSVK